MSAPLIIIGSGFAAYQLIKTLRRQQSDIAIQVITTDAGDEYNKPDLSHVFTRNQSANDLVALSSAMFSEQYQVSLIPHTRVESIDTQARCVMANGQRYPYSKLVLATGAQTFIPTVAGNAAADVLTLNSLQEYRDAQQRIAQSERILIMGGGLIGVELAMDLIAAGKQVRIVETHSHMLANLMPHFVASSLEQHLLKEGVKMEFTSHVTAINRNPRGLVVSTAQGRIHEVDCIISAAGLSPNTRLAKQAGIAVNVGVLVDKQLKTSVADIYALGDCAEIDGKVMSFLQPIVLSANILAKQLLSEPAELNLPAMMVKVKTPNYPIQLGGHFSATSNWQVNFTTQGLTAKAYNSEQKLTGFVVTRDCVNQAFPLLREVQLAQ
ncbi:NADH:flavorubredoxin reductase NorW [Motilimonas cestriensis]|uniref:NADH:flavorubredoxin reductase NorW n=1 Tax=Motilimonas cestriensis TaxID=2742685 RepID=A0ABS8WG83_9GAMM|nr:NADH:flavorubredoxin reductase NorW [Motilimonas cestriensis]MCE2596599.1 NADH:flavorubredoxin reductase NorW [Motilimonas cestriensis]